MKKPMKYLTDYCREGLSQAYLKHGAFYAFSKEQLESSRVAGVEYCDMGCGLIAPIANAEALASDLTKVISEARATDLAENGWRKIVERQLRNHECFYTGDIEVCVEELKPYGITKDEIRVVFKDLLPTIDDL